MKKRLYQVFLIILATLFAFAVGSCSVEQEPVVPPPEPPVYYTVSYSAGAGGSVQGKLTQSIEKGKDGEAVTAIPDSGYEFVKWSDGLTQATRYEKNVNKDIALTASFKGIITTYSLNYKFGSAENGPDKITFDYSDFEEIKFPVPIREHFTFNGWFVGGTQVTDENGEMVIGEELYEVNDTEICAKWTANETFTYKILLVYVTRIDAQLPARDKSGKLLTVDYTMSVREREFFELTTLKLKQIMNDMLDGLVEFQIDGYFTNDTVFTESFKQGGVSTGINNSLFPTDIPEVSSIISNYDSVLSIFNMNDFEYPYKLHDGSGAARAKYGEINFDSFLSSLDTYKYSLEDAIELLKNNQDINLWGKVDLLKNSWFDILIHELAHTIEMRINCYDYHSVISEFVNHQHTDAIESEKLYYLNEAVMDGGKVGIPYGFWKGDIAIVKYRVTEGSHGCQGSVSAGNRLGGVAEPVGSGNRSYEVLYGEYVTATATAYIGIEFVRWSDGVTTPTRTDLITGDFSVTAIFQPITYELTIVAGEGGTIQQGEGTCTLQYNGSSIVITAVAQDGYRFVGWSDGATNYSRPFGVRLSNINLFDENNSYTLTAIFEKIN